MGHSPADPEHERGRKVEKRWARAECDPIKLFEASDTPPRPNLDLSPNLCRSPEPHPNLTRTLSPYPDP